MAHSPFWLTTAAMLLSLGCLAYAAWHDLMVRTIPNGIPLAVAILGLALRWQAGDWLWSLLAAGLVFTLCLIAWRYGMMGGGDVKLIAAATLIVEPLAVPSLLAAIALAGGALALLFLLLRAVLPPPRPRLSRPTGLISRSWRAERRRIARGGPLPYAVAIAIGAAWVVGTAWAGE